MTLNDKSHEKPIFFNPSRLENPLTVETTGAPAVQKGQMLQLSP